MTTLPKSLTLNVYNDPGHGWVACKRTLLQALGIEDAISTFSYQRGQTVYLEEDCDASRLIGALTEHGIEPRFIVKHTDRNSPIRSYDYFLPSSRTPRAATATATAGA